MIYLGSFVLFFDFFERALLLDFPLIFFYELEIHAFRYLSLLINFWIFFFFILVQIHLRLIKILKYLTIVDITLLNNQELLLIIIKNLMQFLILLQWTFLMDVFDRRFIQRRLIKIRGNQEPFFHFNLKLSMVGVCSTQVYQIVNESFFGSDVESGATHSLRVRTVKRLSDGGESIVVVPKMLLRAF